ncbi:sugar phosphate nucleotidyltransferase [Desulfosarcina sp.]|uniref:sugar phosphate nucleotidyltransferase n=1 Tax=Desulfosarcina sp. TaxID=2027861 RepID=UPI003970FEF9
MDLLKQEAIACVGLIPAAGQARRVSPLPCSKEIFPVGFGEIRQKGPRHPKVAAHYLLEKMQRAGAQKTYIVLSKGKWDIPAYFGSGSMVNMAIAYLMTDLPHGVPFTLDSAFTFLQNKRVLFGFPDIIVHPDDVYIQLLDRLAASQADVVLGLFPAVNPQKMDMVELAADGTIAGIRIKPVQTDLKWTWIIAAWNFSFTRFMHQYVQDHLAAIAADAGGSEQKDRREVQIGGVIQAAIDSELEIDSVLFHRGTYIDIGTPEDMVTAVQTHAFRD